MGLVGYDPWVGGGLVGAGCAAAPPFTHQPPLVAPPAGSQQPHTKSRDQEVQGGASILKPTPRLNHRLPQGEIDPSFESALCG